MSAGPPEETKALRVSRRRGMTRDSEPQGVRPERIANDYSRVSPNDLAALMGVDRRTVTRWCSENAPRNDDGTFDVPAVVKWRIAKAEARGQDDQRQRLAAAQAERVERLNQIEAGELLRVDDCLTIWSSILSDARASLLNVGHKLAPLIAHRPAATCARTIDDEIRLILNDLADGRTPDGLSMLRTR